MRWLFGLLVLLACGSARKIFVNGLPVGEKRWELTQQELAGRIATDFSCAQIEFALIHMTGKTPDAVAFAGCGRRGLYVRLQSTWDRTFGEWQPYTESADGGSLYRGTDPVFTTSFPLEEQMRRSIVESPPAARSKRTGERSWTLLTDAGVVVSNCRLGYSEWLGDQLECKPP